MGQRKRRGYGEGAIYQRKDGRWATSVSLGYKANGKRHRRTVYGKTKKEVQDKLKSLHKDLGEGLSITPSRVTVQEHFEGWLQSKRPPTTRETTFAKYYDHVHDYINPHLGHIKLKALNYRHINTMYETLDHQGLSDRYIHDIASTLKAGLKDAVAKGLVPKSPAEYAQKRKFTKKEARFLNQDELSRFRAGIQGDRLEDLFLLGIYTGLRPGELLGLPWDAINWRDQTLTVRQAVTELRGKVSIGPVKTKASKRTISLSNDAVKILRRQHMRQAAEQLLFNGEWKNDRNLVFTDTRGGLLRRSNTRNRSLFPARLRAGMIAVSKRTGFPVDQLLEANQGLTRIKVGMPLTLPSGDTTSIKPGEFLEDMTLHTFRHTHAALLIYSGVDILAVSRRLGHEKIQITLDLYGHIMPDQDAKAAEKMDAFIASLPTLEESGYNMATQPGRVAYL